MKYYQILFTYVALILIINSGNVKAQITNPVFSGIKEEVKILTDRELYFNGENIFFSVYYSFSNNVNIDPLSKIVYVELINCNNGSVYSQKMYSLTNHYANGVIAIPNDISTGNYMLRAYTQFQRNFSILNYGYQFITVINPKNNSVNIPSWQDSDSIWIVPEGNVLIDKIKNNVVVRIPDSLALPENKIFIKDNLENVLVELSDLKLGIVNAELTCEIEKSYSLVIKTNKDKIIKKELPLVQKQGIQTSISQLGSIINYVIQINDVNQLNQNYKIQVISSDYKTILTKEIVLNNQMNYVPIELNTMEKGLNYISLSNSGGEIERINSYFNYFSENTFLVDIETEKSSAGSRETVKAILKTRTGKPKGASVSISIIKKGTQTNTGNFKPSVLFTHPLLINNYIESNGIGDIQVLKMIMTLFDKTINKELFAKMINGQTEQKFDFVPEIRDLTISGVLQDRKTKQPVANQDIYLSVIYNNPQFHIYKTKENGEFIFSLNQLTGINDIFICPAIDNNYEYEILIKNSFSPDIPVMQNLPLAFGYADKQMIEDVFINAQILNKFCPFSEVKTKNRVKGNQFNIDDNNRAFYLNNYIKLESFEEVFTEIVTNAKITKNGDEIIFNVYDKNSYIIPGKPLILVDYLPVFEYQKLLGMHVSQIEKIEVIDKTYILGPFTLNGIIMITTNTDNFGEINFPKSAVFLEYNTINTVLGFSEILKCVSPSPNAPDFRTTLYWNPSFSFDNDSNQFEFTTSDNKGEYEIVIKGFGTDGKYYYGKKEFNVE